jgi:hypothetical protein
LKPARNKSILQWIKSFRPRFAFILAFTPWRIWGIIWALSRRDIDGLKIQEGETKEVLTLLSGSENNSISNIKWTIPMHNALIFKEQAKVKDTGLREKGLAQPHYSIQHIEGLDLLCYKEKIYILQSLTQTTKSTLLVPRIFTSSGTD